MEFKQLEYILAIYKYGSISKAAKNLYLSQPNLSKALKQIESEYHLTIFTRTTKGMQLTEEGEHFLRYVKDIINRKEMMDHVFREWKIQELSVIRLATQHFTFLSGLVNQLYDHLSSHQYKMHINECNRGNVIESVLNHHDHIGLLVMSTMDPKPFKQYVHSLPLEFTRLDDSPVYCCVGKNNPLYDKPKLTFEDVRNQTMIIFDIDEITQQEDNPEEDRLNFGSPHMIITDSLFLSLKLLEHHDTALFTTKWTIDFVKNENIRAIPIEDTYQVNRLYWIKHRNHQPDQLEMMMLKELQARLK